MNYGINIEEELSKILSEELAKQIDREIINNIFNTKNKKRIFLDKIEERKNKEK